VTQDGTGMLVEDLDNRICLWNSAQLPLTVLFLVLFDPDTE